MVRFYARNSINRQKSIEIQLIISNHAPRLSNDYEEIMKECNEKLKTEATECCMVKDIFFDEDGDEITFSFNDHENTWIYFSESQKKVCFQPGAFNGFKTYDFCIQGSDQFQNVIYEHNFTVTISLLTWILWITKLGIMFTILHFLRLFKVFILNMFFRQSREHRTIKILAKNTNRYSINSEAAESIAVTIPSESFEINLVGISHFKAMKLYEIITDIHTK